MFSLGRRVGAVAFALLMVGTAFAIIGSGLVASSGPSIHVVTNPSSPGSTNTPVGPVSTNGLATPGEVSASSARAAGIAKARAAFVAAGGNLSDFHPPSINAATESVSQTGGHIVPLYAETPAPMGIGEYGLKTVNGQVVPYVLNTTSVEGVFSTTDPWGIEDQAYDAGPQEGVGTQLNVIEVGTTLNGQQSFNGNTNEFWLQNTLEYSAGSISFDLNIWNFSYNSEGNEPWSGYSEFPTSTILHGNGRVSGGELYEEGGPKITVAYPFTLDVYINTTVGSYMGSPMVNEVYFNYTVWNAEGQKVCPTTGTCGSYDNVYFNSGVNVAPGSAQIQANGNQYASNGNGTNLDMEFDYGIGDSDAEVANVVYADATLGLYFLNGSVSHATPSGDYSVPTNYTQVLSAYDFGSETGESTQGAYGYWTVQPNGQPIEQYRTGPAILTGLWNVSANAGGHYLNYAGVLPENAWIAIAPGTDVTDQRVLKIAPTFGWFGRDTSNGGELGSNLWLQPGIYTVDVMLSGYDPYIATIDLTHGDYNLTVSLTRDPASTVYTPIYAFTNAELAAVATSGSGTVGSPYVLWNSQAGSFEPIFGDMSQWPFEVWEGIYVNATTAYAVWNGLPSLAITYPWWELQYLEAAPATGPLPFSNHLQVYLYHTSDLTIENTGNISGWFASAATSGYSVIANGVSHSLFAHNYFNVSNLGLELTGGSNNVVWGNTFTPFPQYLQFSGVEHPSTGLLVSESGDHIYNNEFFTNATGSSSTTYSDFWNVSCVAGFNTGQFFAGTACEPLSYSTTFNGVTLTGSIVPGVNYQGGNYWFNYGLPSNPYGLLPYEDRASAPTGAARLGGITTGVGNHGDYAPLIPFYLTGQSFTESGLPAVTSWTVDVFGTGTLVWANTSTTATITLYVPSGSYTYGIPGTHAGSGKTETNWSAGSAATGSFSAGSGPGVNSAISFTFLAAYVVTFTEVGLVTGVVWRVQVAGQLATYSTTTSATILLPTGSYTYTVPTVPGYSTSPSGSFSVSGAPTGVTITFSIAAYLTTFTETGLPHSTEWTITVTESGEQVALSSTSASITTDLGNGTYPYVASGTSGYAANPAIGSVTVLGAPASATITYAAAYAVTFTETGLPVTDGDAWTVNVTGQVPVSTSATSVVLNLSNAGYTYSITSHTTYLNPGGLPSTGYSPSPPTGSFTVSSAPKTVATTFALTTYAVTFVESGLPAGTSWSVNLITGHYNATFTTTASSQVAIEVNSTYDWSILPVAGYQTPAPGNFLLWGVPLTVYVTFVPAYTIAFTESGLPGGTWSVTILEQTHSAAAGSPIDFSFPNGTWSFTVGFYSGYASSPSSGTVTVNGAATTQPITFTQVTYPVGFSQSGLPGADTWYINITGGPDLSATGASPTISTSLPNGTWSFTVATNDKTYAPSYASGSVMVNGAGASAPPITFTHLTYTLSFSESGLPSTDTWYVNITGGAQLSATGATTTLSTVVPNGTYSYSVATNDHTYAPSYYSGSVTVSGASASAPPITFGQVTYTLSFSESGLPSTDTWYINVTGGASLSATGATTTLSTTVTNGSYSYTVATNDNTYAPNYYSDSVTVNGASTSAPAITFSLVTYAVTFTETGLPSGTSWTVDLAGSNMTSTGTTITFAEINGTYAYSVTNTYGGTASGSVTVNGAAASATIAFYHVEFSEKGLAKKTSWSVTTNGDTRTSTGTSISFYLTDGSYSFTASGGKKYATLSGTFSVSNAAKTIDLKFTKAATYTVEFKETGLPKGTSWEVTFNGTTVVSTSKTISFKIGDGTYSFTVSSADYSASPSSGSITVNNAKVTQKVTFTKEKSDPLAAALLPSRWALA
jgi:hypothetical protein